MFKPYYLKTIIISLLLFVLSIISVFMPYLYKLIIDDSILKDNFQNLIKWLLLIVFFLLLQEIIYIFQIKITLKMRKEMFSTLRKNIYNKLMGFSQNYYSKAHTGVLLSIITSDVDALQNLLLEKFAYFLQNILTSLLIVCIIGYINLKMLLFSIIFIPILYIIYIFFSKKIKNLNFITQEKKAILNEHLREDFSFVKMIQSFVLFDYRAKITNNTIDDLEDSKKNLSFQYTKSASSTVIITIMGVLVIWGYGSYEVIKNHITIGTLVAISFYLNYIQNLFFNTYYTVIGFNSAIPSAERIFKILDTKSDINDSEKTINIHKLDGNIVFKHVYFGYNKYDIILSDLNFIAEKNDIIAIIGENGSGKTTLTNLIARFYDPCKGTIKINDIDIKKIKINSLRKDIAIVPQEDYLFNDTIKENITVGRENITVKQFEEAIRLSGVEHFINNMSDGIDTYIGENGKLLSGGQRKRILIARAIIYNPYIIIFDEATANLDLENENLILNSIKKLSKDRIIFYISHKPLNLKLISKVFKLDESKLI
jgi:ABC-type multidrug transport system fused ATPase/permease subunit